MHNFPVGIFPQILRNIFFLNAYLGDQIYVGISTLTRRMKPDVGVFGDDITKGFPSIMPPSSMPRAPMSPAISWLRPSKLRQDVLQPTILIHLAAIMGWISHFSRIRGGKKQFIFASLASEPPLAIGDAMLFARCLDVKAEQ